MLSLMDMTTYKLLKNFAISQVQSKIKYEDIVKLSKELQNAKPSEMTEQFKFYKCN